MRSGLIVINRPADVTGLYGAAWKIPPRPTRTEHLACLCQYLLRVTGAHPLWDRWIVSLVHLRDLPGVEPAVIRTPGATHELMVDAVNPDGGALDPDAMPEHYPLLQPIDLAVQFQGLDDTGSIALAEDAVRLMVAGEMSPDQDWRGVWHRAIPLLVQRRLHAA